MPSVLEIFRSDLLFKICSYELPKIPFIFTLMVTSVLKWCTESYEFIWILCFWCFFFWAYDFFFLHLSICHNFATDDDRYSFADCLNFYFSVKSGTSVLILFISYWIVPKSNEHIFITYKIVKNIIWFRIRKNPIHSKILEYSEYIT